MMYPALSFPRTPSGLHHAIPVVGPGTLALATSWGIPVAGHPAHASWGYHPHDLLHTSAMDTIRPASDGLAVQFAPTHPGLAAVPSTNPVSVLSGGVVTGDDTRPPPPGPPPPGTMVSADGPSCTKESPGGVVSTVAPVSDANAWQTILMQLRGIMSGERDAVANCANAASLLWHGVTERFGSDVVNWVGVYFVRPVATAASQPTREPSTAPDSAAGGTHELVLGPFHGKPACIRIPWGRGACGTAARERRTVAHRDVTAVANYISCDAASQAEVVVPLFAPVGSTGERRVVGVLDIDGPAVGCLDGSDPFWEAAARAIEEACDWREICGTL
eukprot:TRINITY_DN8634_c0_g1_i1.p1 TRINITY_DN8634_c0_g1~~TRINITY_DN8634_c0_g1_i1.p1  ORF type:complete len:332 (+),score=38.25 TRINITY_DN8634_c0_g1_i1:71-1066(+)